MVYEWRSLNKTTPLSSTSACHGTAATCRGGQAGVFGGGGGEERRGAVSGGLTGGFNDTSTKPLYGLSVLLPQVALWTLGFPETSVKAVICWVSLTSHWSSVTCVHITQKGARARTHTFKNSMPHDVCIFLRSGHRALTGQYLWNLTTSAKYTCGYWGFIFI